ncbi:MAG: polysaccharide deacetylase family protein [Candidatus Omnitrophica bacterium]|nr:polysaccharide deacetylase family protein [Candidatus Omnitrophota bacterium]
MKMRGGWQILCSCGLHHGLRFMLRRNVLILMYHGFLAHEDGGELGPYLFNDVTAGRFEEQLCYLKKYYHPVSLMDVVAASEGKKTLPPYAVVLTFDDGYASNYEQAFPLLKKYHVPATVFVTTAFLDRKIALWSSRLAYSFARTQKERLKVMFGAQEFDRPIRTPRERLSAYVAIKTFLKNIHQEQREGLIIPVEAALGVALVPGDEMPAFFQPLSWAQAREMAASDLVTIGSHTHEHFILGRTSVQEARRQLSLSKERIEAETGRPCILFCYPNGDEGDFSDTTSALVQEAGYCCALTTVPGHNDPARGLFTLKRMVVDRGMDLAYFKMHIVMVRQVLLRLKKKLAYVMGKVVHARRR